VSTGTHSLNDVNSSGDTQIYSSNYMYFTAYNDTVNSSECGVSNVWLMSGE
jgi:hypothetical protein